VTQLLYLIRLDLSWSTVSKQQLAWLLPRLPQMRKFSLSGLEFNTSVCSLATANAPMLQHLDLSYITNFNDTSLYKILSGPKDSRPGLLDKKTRLKNLIYLDISGTEVSDVGLRYVAQYLPTLAHLRLGQCWKLTDAGLAQLSLNDTKLAETLKEVDASGCKGVGDIGVSHLARCRQLERLDCSGTSASVECLRKFAEQSQNPLKVVGHVVQLRLSKR